MTIGNRMYPGCKKRLSEMEIEWVGGTVKGAALDASYVYSGAHVSLDDLSGILDVVIVPGRALSLDGVWSNDNLSPGPVIPTGDVMRQLVFFIDSGVPTTSWLLLFMDTNSDLTPIARTGVGDPVVIPFPGNTWELVDE